MRFTKQKNGSYRAASQVNNALICPYNVLIWPSHGGWQVTINSIDVEWFLHADLVKAKAFAKARIANALGAN